MNIQSAINAQTTVKLARHRCRVLEQTASAALSSSGIMGSLNRNALPGTCAAILGCVIGELDMIDAHFTQASIEPGPTISRESADNIATICAGQVQRAHELRLYVENFRERNCPGGFEPLFAPLSRIESELRLLTAALQTAHELSK